MFVERGYKMYSIILWYIITNVLYAYVVSTNVGLAILRGIAQVLEHELSTTSPDSKTSSLGTASISSIIRRRFHPLGPRAALHSIARTRLERVIILALKFLSPELRERVIRRLYNIEDDDTETMLDFAECIDPTKLFDCSVPTINQFRTIDGTCNNLERPLLGASATEFSRLLPSQYEDGISVPVGHDQQVNGNPFGAPWPSARSVSAAVILDEPDLSTALTHMFMLWGQFVDHDLDLFAEFETEECEESCDFEETCPFCFPITVLPNDTTFGVNGPNNGDCLPLTRSVGSCMRPLNSKFEIAREQINQLTHYQDASNVYGSTKEEADSLRLFSGGLLRQGGRTDSLKGNLPVGSELSDSGAPFFVAGDVRANEHVALTIMHTIWLREHNRLVRQLAELNPCWDDERLYQEGRKIVGALMQVITYKEFLPLFLGDAGFEKFIGPYSGYNSDVNASVPNSFATAAFRVGHTLIRPKFARLDNEHKPLPIGPLGLRESFFNPLQYYISGGTDPILRGLLEQKSREVDEFVNIVLTTKLFAPSNDSLGQDLAARNIQRGREHAIPSYREFREFCSNKFDVSAEFTSLTTELRLRDLYGAEGFTDGIDLWVGGLAEKVPKGSNLGPTFSCIIGTTFGNLRDGDRFYYENPGVFTEDQRNSLSNVKFSKVICDNADDIKEIIPKAFEIGQQKQDCDSLSSLNLNLWKDTC